MNYKSRPATHCKSPFNYRSYKVFKWHTESSWQSVTLGLLSPSTTDSLNSDLRLSPVQSQGHIATDDKPVSKFWPDIYYCLTVTILFLWGALSDERRGLSFIIAAGPRQRRHSQVRVPWDSRPYFTVSDLRLPFSSPPTTRRVTVEVFDPASTRVSGYIA
jgi:hypothetical protein